MAVAACETLSDPIASMLSFREEGGGIRMPESERALIRHAVRTLPDSTAEADLKSVMNSTVAAFPYTARYVPACLTHFCPNSLTLWVDCGTAATLLYGLSADSMRCTTRQRQW